MEERIVKLAEFIENNGLYFSDTGSELNSECCTISGYALHLGTTDVTEIEEAIERTCPDTDGNYLEELERVFEFAQANDYGKWWKKIENKKLYTF